MQVITIEEYCNVMERASTPPYQKFTRDVGAGYTMTDFIRDRMATDAAWHAKIAEAETYASALEGKAVQLTAKIGYRGALWHFEERIPRQGKLTHFLPDKKIQGELLPIDRHGEKYISESVLIPSKSIMVHTFNQVMEQYRQSKTMSLLLTIEGHYARIDDKIFSISHHRRGPKDHTYRIILQADKLTHVCL